MLFLATLTLATAVASIPAKRATKNQVSTSIKPQAKAPSNASNKVDQSYPSFAIQGSSFPFYTGNLTSPNTFSNNLIQQIQQRVGGPLVVRVGGTNTDFSNYNPNQTVPITPPMTGNGIGEKFVFGPSFYVGFKNWVDTKWVYDVPFAMENMTVSYDEAKEAIDNIGKDNLWCLELGNEVDLYVGQGVRPAGWDPAEYVSQFDNYSAWLNNALDMPDLKYEVLTLAGESPGGLWNATAVFEDGITESGRVKSVSLHNYETTASSGTALQETMMNHGYITSSLDNYLSDIDYMEENWPQVPVVFGESGRYAPGGSSTDPTQGIFGAALWTVDYLLYLMSLSIYRVNMQLSIVFGYVAWHPVYYNGNVPEVRSPYYGHLFVSDFMGGSSSFRVAQIDVDSDYLAAYAGYGNNELTRLVIINFNVWIPGSENRPSEAFEIEVPSSVSSGVVTTLTSPGGATAMNEDFSWGGMTWTYAKDGLPQKFKGASGPRTIMANERMLKLEVGASEAVMIQFQ